MILRRVKRNRVNLDAIDFYLSFLIFCLRCISANRPNRPVLKSCCSIRFIVLKINPFAVRYLIEQRFYLFPFIADGCGQNREEQRTTTFWRLPHLLQKNPDSSPCQRSHSQVQLSRYPTPHLHHQCQYTDTDSYT